MCNAFFPPPPLFSQGGNSSSKALNSSAASKLKHLQQNSTDKTKSGKREDFLNTQGQQQVSCLFFALSSRMHAWSLSACADGTARYFPDTLGRLLWRWQRRPEVFCAHFKKYASVNGIKKITLFKRNCLLEGINQKILCIYVYIWRICLIICWIIFYFALKLDFLKTWRVGKPLERV